MKGLAFVKDPDGYWSEWTRVEGAMGARGRFWEGRPGARKLKGIAFGKQPDGY